MDFYTRNLQVIKERFPYISEERIKSIPNSTVEVVSSQSGLPTFYYKFNDKKILFHSRVNPLKEAEDILKTEDYSSARYLFVFGLGFGYHLNLVLSNPYFKGKIFVFEPSEEIFKLALENVDLTRILTDDRIHLFIISEKLNVEEVIDELKLYQYGVLETKILALPVYTKVFTSFYNRILEKLRYQISQGMCTYNVIDEFSSTWQKNVLENFPCMLKGFPLSIFKNKFKKMPAIIVSAGPSLDKNIKKIKLCENKAVIISVGTALKALLKEEIKPDFVVIVDASDIVYEQFKGIEDKLSSIWLFADPLANSSVVKLFEERTIFFHVVSDAYFYYAYPKRFIKDSYVRCGGTVAEAGLDIAVKMGLNPIIFVGQDLCFLDDGKTHASGTVYSENKATLSNDPLSFIYLPGNYQEKVVVPRNFYVFLRWLEKYIREHPKIKFINATEGGVKIEGTEVLNLDTAIKEYLKKDYNIKNIIDTVCKNFKENLTIPYKKISKVIKATGKLEKSLNKSISILSKIEKFLNSEILLSEKEKNKIMQDFNEELNSLVKNNPYLSLFSLSIQKDLIDAINCVSHYHLKEQGYSDFIIKLKEILTKSKETLPQIQDMFFKVYESFRSES